jgi:hypothetical protein
MAFLDRVWLPVLTALVVGFVLRSLWQIVYNLWFHPLRDFPGPILARATRWYETYYDVIKRPGGQYIYEVERQHQKYGMIHSVDCQCKFIMLIVIQVLLSELILMSFTSTILTILTPYTRSTKGATRILTMCRCSELL